MNYTRELGASTAIFPYQSVVSRNLRKTTLAAELSLLSEFSAETVQIESQVFNVRLLASM